MESEGRKLPGAGRTVVVTGGRRRVGAAISRRLAACGWNVVAVGRAEADFAEPLAAVRLFDALCRAHPDVSCWVNNAAVYDPALDDATVMRVNAEVPEKFATLLGLRLMEHAPFKGAVVHVLDAHVLPPPVGEESAYLKSKRRLLDAVTRQAGLFAGSLRVNGVAPGPVLAPERVHEKADATLLARRPTPDDVADAVAFLLGNEAVTGCVVPVDAGSRLAV